MVSRRSGGEALLLTEIFPPAIGGSAVLFEGIYSRLRDVDVRVLTDTASAGDTSGPRELRVAHGPLATSRWGVMDPRALAHHLRVGWQARRLVSRRGVVHCGRALPEGVAAMLSRLAGGPRYVCWAHGEDIGGRLASRELALLTKLVFRLADAAIANSRNTAALLESVGVPAGKIVIVYPAVDSDRFTPDVDGSVIRARYAGPGDVLLLSVGRLQRRKGHDMAIEAVARLRSELPRLRYVIAGDGHERMRLEQLARDRGVDDIVFFAGAIADDELPAYYAACDVFLMPNREEDGDLEGFGIVFLEAAATGKPVIGGDSGGVPEAVERDVTGLLVEGRDPDAVREAIRTLASSADLRQRMGLAGRRRARDLFSWSHAAALISDLQRRLSSSPSGVRADGQSRSIASTVRRSSASARK